MASCNVTMLSSSFVGATREIYQDQSDLCRSHSSKDLCKGAAFRRSYSDNHLCRSSSVRAAAARPRLRHSPSAGIISFRISSSFVPDLLRSVLFDSETSRDMSIVEPDIEIDDNSDGIDEGGDMEIKRANWVERLLEIRSHWRSRQQMTSRDGDKYSENDENGDPDGGCEVDYSSEEDGDDGELEYDQKSFSNLLDWVPLYDVKRYSQLAFLSNMAYVIPTIRAEDLRRSYRLHFVTSSIERKAEATAIKAKFDEDSIRIPVASEAFSDSSSEKTTGFEQKCRIHPSVVYDIAASAASYIHSQAKELSSVGSESQQKDNGIEQYGSREKTREEGDNSPRLYNSEVAAYMAASTMTAVVAAGEKAKQEAARDLQSLHSSPCEWFICDDLSTYTRCFIIQGSDSLASWQANLFFDPIKFEETDGIVHRGIYEAAKGMYQQFIPEIIDHLNRFGDCAKFQFAGHSLGGSLALLVNLILIARKVVKPSNLHPVVTFGSPFVFCGGLKILKQLGLDENILQSVMMHRDIVPRAFSCSYPGQITVLLKRLAGSFRTHPCLVRNRLLYTPFGKVFILQPDEKSSPPHPLLPRGSAFYSLNKDRPGYSANALRSFLNCPHPLETLSDPTAYGSEGTILRDHDSSNYLKAINGVLRQHNVLVRRLRTHRDQLWPLLASPAPHLRSHDGYTERTSFRNKEVLTGV